MPLVSTHRPQTDRAVRSTAILAFGLMANLVPLATFAAVMPAINRAWGLDAGEAGWIGGIYFAGYALSVPVLAGITDRLDAGWIFVGTSLLGAVSSLGFGLWADGFWAALLLRFLSGVALAGVQMPGLKLLSERTAGRARARASAFYTASYALGVAGSFLLAGIVESAAGWRATFLVSGLGPLLAVAALALLPAALPAAAEGAPAPAFSLDFRPVLRDRALMAYVVAFAGNTWEVFAVRVWFVAYLTWTLGLPGNAMALPAPAVISGLASLAGFPVNLAIAELALRYGQQVIVATCAASVAVCLALAATAGGATAVVLALLILVKVTSIADVGALTSGAVETADPARRGARRLRLHRLRHRLRRTRRGRPRPRPLRRRRQRRRLARRLRGDCAGLRRRRLGAAQAATPLCALTEARSGPAEQAAPEDTGASDE